MRDVVERNTPGLVGWSASHGHPVFHDVASQDEGGPGGTATCDTHLAFIAGPEHIRPYERPCLKCRPKGPPAHRTTTPVRRKAIIRTPLVAPVAPVAPHHLRVTPEGHLAVRGASSDPSHPWLILDMNHPLLMSVADDTTAGTWPTLRSRWPTEVLVNAVAIADRFGVDRTFVAKWRKDPEFPLVACTIADRPGWYLETLPLIDRWHKNRPGRTGRPPQDT